MKEKQKALEKLKEMGYNAILEEGVIIITTDEKHLSLDKIRKDIEKLEYKYSWGIRFNDTSTT